ncbi:ProQ activator of osmoprotectant transporter prop [Burkholderia plantarii]|uniref:ProQ/FinO family protein n=1 Tax=Burkholderia plantarii TaxID=41899 RepID=UPI00272A9088|nr:ProQ/FinO family protein [Burkholderia plantarii]WLE62617.1 ProQ activator of osmoprotectant transporter prop [Burkholderia plantarii]
MGFEQLAELKKQLAKQRADAKPQARQGKPSGQPAAKPSGGKPPAKSSKPAHHQSAGKPAAAHGGGKPSAGKPQQHARRPAPAADAKPVNPTVLAIGKLQRRFPVAFPKSPAPKVPLKIGIFKDLVAHTAELGLDEAQLRDAIKEWCRGSRYWACLVDGAARVDLTGAEAGTVTAQQAAGAVRLDAARRSRASGKGKAGDTKRGDGAKGAPDANAASEQDAAAAAQPEAAEAAADAAPAAEVTAHAAGASATPAPDASEAVETAASDTDAGQADHAGHDAEPK